MIFTKWIKESPYENNMESKLKKCWFASRKNLMIDTTIELPEVIYDDIEGINYVLAFKKNTSIRECNFDICNTIDFKRHKDLYAKWCYLSELE